MTILKFKTNIISSSAVGAVSNTIDKINNIINWEVETANPEKILTVRGEAVSAARVVGAVRKAGFQIARVQ
jgi:copper chaperone